MAERVGFEPTDACASPVFKTGSFNRSDISPSCEGCPSLEHLKYDTISPSYLSTGFLDSGPVKIFQKFLRNLNLGVAFF